MLNGIFVFNFSFSFSGGKPISESLDSVKMACVHTAPENRFKYIWKILRPEQVSDKCNWCFVVSDKICFPVLDDCQKTLLKKQKRV